MANVYSCKLLSLSLSLSLGSIAMFITLHVITSQLHCIQYESFQ